jgi:hypothetical protein
MVQSLFRTIAEGVGPQAVLAIVRKASVSGPKKEAEGAGLEGDGTSQRKVPGVQPGRHPLLQLGSANPIMAFPSPRGKSESTKFAPTSDQWGWMPGIAEHSLLFSPPVKPPASPTEVAAPLACTSLQANRRY